MTEQAEAERPIPTKGPRARTRKLMLETAIRLMQNGATPSVSDVSEAAEVSRATAYRYFPSQAALVQAVVDEALGPILDWQPGRGDAKSRVVDLLSTSVPRLAEFEATFRAALRLSLEQWARREAGTLGEEAAFSRGHRLPLLKQALAPLAETLSPEEFDRLSNALALVFGIESMVVFRDICGLSASQTQDLATWMATALMNHALNVSPE